MSTMRLLVGTGMVVLAAFAHAACEMPNKPDTPDGAAADEAAMVEGQAAVRAYIEKTNAYLDCLVAEARAGEETDDAQAKQKRLDRYNEGVAAMEETAEAFNNELREFKARQ